MKRAGVVCEASVMWVKGNVLGSGLAAWLTALVVAMLAFSLATPSGAAEIISTGHSVAGTTASLPLTDGDITQDGDLALSNVGSGLLCYIMPSGDGDWYLQWGGVNLPSATYNYAKIDFAAVSSGLVAGQWQLYWQDDDSTIGGGNNSVTFLGDVTPSSTPFSVVIDLTSGGTMTNGPAGWGPGQLDTLRLDVFEGLANAGETFTISAVTLASDLEAAVSLSDISASNVKSYSATLNLTLDVTGTNAAVVAYWGPTDGANDPGAWSNSAPVAVYGGPGATTLSHVATGLDASTTYYYTFRATNDLTDLWAGSSDSFTTGPAHTAPTAGLGGGATGIAPVTATLRGELTAGAAAEVYICWGETDGGTASIGDWDHVIAIGDVLQGDVFSSVVTEAFYGVEYDYRVYVTNNAGDAWSSLDSFSTPLDPYSLWSPSVLGPQLWLDAADTGTVVLNGDTVAQWNDKSGNGRDATQATPANQPTNTVGGLNGNNVVTFDGTDDFLGVDLDFLAGVSHSAFVVTRPTDYTDIYGAADAGQGNRSLHVGFRNTSQYRMNYWGNDFYTGISGNFQPGQGNVLNYVWIPGTSKEIFANGGSEGTSGSAGTIGTMSGGGRIGQVVNHGNYGGDLAEIVMFTGGTTAEERQTMEGYLAWKWGTEDALPAGHPSKMIAPYNGMAIGIDNRGATRVGALDADVSGQLNADGSIFTVTVYWSTNNNADSAAWMGDGTASSAVVGTFSNVVAHSVGSTIDTLSGGTTYYYTMMASNASTNVWATPSGSFTTLAQPTTPTAGLGGGVTGIGIGSATLRGELVAGGSADLYICWGADDGGATSTSNWDNVVYVGERVVGDVQSIDLTGLFYGIEYDYRVFATSVAGDSWSSVDSFLTVLPVVPKGGETPGTDFHVDAGQDTDGDQYWEDLVPGNPSGLGLLLDNSPAVNRVSISTGTTLTDAYDFPGGSTGNEAGALLIASGTTTVRSFQDAPGDWSNNAMTMEIWFRPDNLTPTPSNGQIIFEDGGGSGLGFFVDNNEIVLAQDNNAPLISYNVATDPSGLLLAPATNEFIQAVVTRTQPGGTTFYINGQPVGTASDDGDWSGGDDAAFGTRGASNVGGRGGGQANTESFDGQIALVRVYDGQVLTPAEVQANYEAVILTLPPFAIANTTATGVSYATADLAGTLDCPGAAFDVTVYFSTNDNPDVVSWMLDPAANSTAVGSFADVTGQVLSQTVTGLLSDVTYYYTMMASNDGTNVWASPNVSFTTLQAASAPTAGLAGGATAVGISTATLNGEIAAGGSGHLYLCWGENDGGTSSVGDWENSLYMGEMNQGVVVSEVLTDLLYGIEYDYRVYVTNNVGTSWSALDSFSTVTEPRGTWEPMMAGPHLWLDADDAGTLSLASNQVVQWDDKSGNNRHVFQPVTNDRPAYSMGVVSFDGTSDHLWNSNAFMYANGQVDVYVVGAVNPITDDRVVAEGYSSNNIPLYCIAETHNGDGSRMCTFIRNDGNATLYNHSALSASGAFDETMKIYEWRDTGSSLAARFNGGAETSAGYSRSGTMSLDRFAVGALVRAGNSASVWSDSDLNEIFICDNLTDADRLRMEGYLAWKWDLVDQLPGSHRYKTFPVFSGMGVSIEAASATDVRDTSVELGGTLFAEEAVFTVTAYWSTNDNADAAAWTGDLSASSAVVGTFTNVMDQPLSVTAGALTPATTYYYTMVASNESTNLWASPNAMVTTLTTASAPTAGTAGGATDIGVGTASLRGQLTGGSYADAYLCWGTTDGGTSSTSDWDNVISVGLLNEGDSVTNALSELNYGIEYDYRVYVTNPAGSGWSSVASFMTDLPTVGAFATTFGVGVSGMVDYDNGGAFGGASWHVKNSGATSGFTRKGYVRFDTSAIERPVSTASMDIVISVFGLTVDRDVNVYGITNQSLDNVTLDNSLTWATAPANDTSSAFAADLTQAQLLGSFTVLATDGAGTTKNFSSPALIDLINADSNGAITLILGRPDNDGNNLMFAGESNGSYDPPTLVVPMPQGTCWITNTGVTGVSDTEAVLEGKLESAGSFFAVTAYWSTNNNPDSASWSLDGTALNAVVGSYTNVNGQTVSLPVDSLLPDTTYYYTLRASNDATNLWPSANGMFTTLPAVAAPSVGTAGGAVVGVGSASLRGQLTAGSYADAYICWGMSDAGTGSTSDWEHVVSVGNVVEGDVFTSSVSGLYYGIEYDYRVYVINAVSDGWSAPATFTTVAGDRAPDAVLSYHQITSDADSGIDSAKTYTHAIDLGNGAPPLVNGVQFVQDINTPAGVISNAGSRTYGPSSHGGNTPPAVTGSIADVFRDMRYNGPDMGYVELTGLTPGLWYDVRLYDRAWDYQGAIRTFLAGYDVGGDGAVEFWTPEIDQNRPMLDPPGLASNVSWAMSHQYKADASGTMRVLIDLPQSGGGSYHFYGLTNEELGSGAPDFDIVNSGAIPDTFFAELTGTLDAPEAVFSVYAYLSKNDNATPTDWQNDTSASSVFVGTYTNVTGEAVSAQVTGLTSKTPYFYTFMASNVSTDVWAAPNGSFTTKPLTGTVIIVQ